MARIIFDRELKRYVCDGCGDIVPSEMIRQFKYCPMCGRRIVWIDSAIKEW